MNDDADNTRVDRPYADPFGASPSPGIDWTSLGSTMSAFGKAAGSAVGQAGVGTIGAGIGTAMQFAGTLLAARQAKKAANYNAEIARRNSEMAAQALEIEAQQRARNVSILLNDIVLVHQSQEDQERQQRLQQAHVAGQTRAIIGASGLMMRGSPLAVYEHNLHQSEREILAGRYKADLQERALREQAAMEGYAADLSRYGAAERLRVGKAQGALMQYGGSQQQRAGVASALGGLASGGARTTAAFARHQAQRGPVYRDGSSDGRDV
jgi:hypothetical protein